MKRVSCKHTELNKRLICKSCGVKVDIREKRNKYGNRRTDGFDSAKEARRYQALKNDPLVFGLECQKEYSLDVNGHVICKYRADFVYARVVPPQNTTRMVVEDVKPRGKGFKATAAYRMFVIKKNLMLAIHNLEIQEI